MKDAVLGGRYDLSLAFVSPKESQTLNKKHRGKNKPANVLSFPLSATSGEIIICLTEARKDAPKFDEMPRAFVAHLFIHACLHLKGMKHGSTMEKKERQYLKKFGF